MIERAAVTTRTTKAAGLTANGVLQRKCATCSNHTITEWECAECGKKKGLLQRKTASSEGTNEVPPIVYEVLGSAGQPLDAATRAFMEPRFGHDFSSVRLYTGTKAAESAQAVNALAYTVGNNVVFGSSQYNPTSNDGRKLLVHELAHVLQNSSGSLKSSTTPLAIGEPGDSYEREAEALAAQVSIGEKVTASPLSGSPSAASIQRQVNPTTESSDGRAGCAVGSGITNLSCSAYVANAWWLPFAYVNNARCACQETPNVPTANCVRKFLQDRMAATPAWLKTLATIQKPNDNPLSPGYAEYQAFVQTFLTPRIYLDHVAAYASCCCSSGPADYPAWIGVTTVPLPCAAVGASIRQFGSCHGTPGTW